MHYSYYHILVYYGIFLFLRVHTYTTVETHILSMESNKQNIHMNNIAQATFLIFE